MLYEDFEKPLPLFSFQRLNKYFFLPFFVPIICFTTKFFSETMKTDGDNKNIKDVKIDETHTFVFLYQIIQSICLILGGLLYFVNIYKSKTRLKKDVIIIEDEDSKSNKSIDSGNIFRKSDTFRIKVKSCKNIILTKKI